MIGTRFNPAYAYEPNPAGLQGPRGCDPLGLSRPNRIARAQPDWYAPTSKQFALASTPVKVASLDNDRALISFAAQITQTVQSAGGVILSISQRDSAGAIFTLCLPAVFLAAGSPPPVNFHVCKQYSYEVDGALVNSEWWARVFDGPTGASLNVTTWRFRG